MNLHRLFEITAFSPRLIESPSAWIGHLPFSAWLIQELSPSIFVELGTHFGHSYFAFCQSVLESKLTTKCYAVDTWQGDEHANYYGEEVFTQVNEHNQKFYGEFSRLMRMRFDDATSYFSDASIDLLHIDGFHSYEAAKHDFETWLPKLAPGAVVLFHDTNVRERNFGIWKLWEELSESYPSNLEFPHAHGLGVIQLDGAEECRKLTWLHPSSSDEKLFLKRHFASLGTRQLERYELANTRRLAANLQQTIYERDTRIASLNQALSERDTRVAGLDQALAERDARIASLDQALAERGARIADLDQALCEHGRKIEALTGSVAQISTTVVERDRMLDELIRTGGERQQRIAQLEQQAIEYDRAVVSQAATIAELFDSTSWRATRPLRAIGSLWYKIRKVATVARRLATQESLSSLTRRILRIWWREGFDGIRPRIRQQYLLTTQADPVPAPVAQPPQLDTTSELVTLARDREGRYALIPPPGMYTYVEPQRPANFEAWLTRLSTLPRFAIVVPVYNTPPALLDALVASVAAQWYPHWQLVLADDASPSMETRAALTRLRHPQINIVHLAQNLGISGATNAAIAAATDHDFVVFLDHDDEITVDCLYELARCIEREQPDFIYSDEDKISVTGNYVEPHFKPDWSPDTMMSTMFTCHVSCVRRNVLEAVGGLRSQFDGCQDWDFVLRVSEHTDRISHVPRVLYHWRVIPGSTAANIAAKPYILDSSRAVREDALGRRGQKGRVEAVTEVPGYFRVIYAMRDNPLISIIVPTRDNERILRRCIESIKQKTQTSSCRYEIIVMDNGSIEAASVGYLQQISTYEHIRVIRHDAPFNFSELNNLGVNAARGELLLFLNDDVEVLQDDWLERLGGYAQQTHVGAVGAKLLFPGGSEIQHAGVLNLANGPVHAFRHQPVDTPGYFMRNLLEYNWLAVTGACLMIERRKFLAVHGFCETLPVAYNDIDLCMRLVAAGYYNVVCPAVRLIHHESASRGSDSTDPVKAARLRCEMAHLYQRNPAFFQRDPFHNPNLHPNGIHFETPT